MRTRMHRHPPTNTPPERVIIVLGGVADLARLVHGAMMHQTVVAVVAVGVAAAIDMAALDAVAGSVVLIAVDPVIVHPVVTPLGNGFALAATTRGFVLKDVEVRVVESGLYGVTPVG